MTQQGEGRRSQAYELFIRARVKESPAWHEHRTDWPTYRRVLMQHSRRFLYLVLLMAMNLAAFLSGPTTTVAWGTAAGALTGLGWVAPAIATIALFERRSARYIAINGGYFAVAFVVMGAILGAWR